MNELKTVLDKNHKNRLLRLGQTATDRHQYGRFAKRPVNDSFDYRIDLCPAAHLAGVLQNAPTR